LRSGSGGRHGHAGRHALDHGFLALPADPQLQVLFFDLELRKVGALHQIDNLLDLLDIQNRSWVVEVCTVGRTYGNVPPAVLGLPG
jgi:hypothetical protein